MCISSLTVSTLSMTSLHVCKAAITRLFITPRPSCIWQRKKHLQYTLLTFCFCYFFFLKLGNVIAFYHCDKIPKIINLMEKSFILAHGFRDFSKSQLAPCVLGLWEGRTSWQGAQNRAKLFTSQRQESKERGGAGAPISPPRSHTSMT